MMNMVIILPITVRAETYTPTSIDYYNGHKYAVYDESMTWYQAQKYCESVGGHLVTISSEDENQFCSNIIVENGKKTYWIGYSDNEEEGEWNWVDDSISLYTNWRSGEPNNFSYNGITENFAIIYACEKIGLWVDIGYNGGISAVDQLTNIGFVCEWDGVSINGKGYAYLRYNLSDKDGNPLSKTRVNYSIDGYVTSAMALTDENGTVCVQTPELDSSQELTIRFTSPYGIEITDNVKTANITVEPLSYSQSWKGQVGGGFELSAGLQLGANIGVAEAEAKAGSASLGGDLSRAIELEHNYSNDSRELKISSTLNSDFAGKLKAGLWASGNVADELFKVNVALIETGPEGTIGSDVTKSMAIDNYDPTNSEHIAKVAAFLMDNFSNNPLAQIIISFMPIDCHNEETYSQILTASYGADLGKIEINNADIVTLGSIAPSSTYTRSSSKNLETGVYTFTNGYAISAGYDILSLDFAGVNVGNTSGGNTIESGTNPTLFSGNWVNNNIEFKSQVNGGQFEKFTITSLEEDNTSGFLFGETSNSIEKNVIYTGSQAKKLIESDNTLTNLALGQIAFVNNSETEYIMNKIATANTSGTYEKDKKSVKTTEIPLGIGAKAGIGVDFNLTLSGIYSDQFTYENGAVVDNTEQIQSVSTADAEFEASKRTLQQIVAEPIQYIGDVIAGNVNYITGKAVEGVTNAGAKIKGTADYVIDIIYMAVPQVQTFSVLAVAEETDTFDTSSVATTVGNPYVINVKDNDGNTVSDFSATPLQLTLEYTAEELSAAGINNTIEDLNNLKIYWYNEETGVFVYVGGELDYENSLVTADITKSGQYILAFDNCAPSVTNFTATNNTATPTFKATVADMSGISEFLFEIDGKKFVNSENINKFYSTDTAAFEYQITEELDDGEHTATITASDSAGNSMVNPMTITFSVDTVAPMVDNLDISDKIIDGKINVSVAVRDNNINSVKAYVENEKGIYTYNLQETDGIWSAEIDIPKDNSVNVWITAYDSAGNSTNSEIVKVVSRISSTITDQKTFNDANVTGVKFNVNNSSDTTVQGLKVKYGEEERTLTETVITGSGSFLIGAFVPGLVELTESNFEITAIE